MSSGDVEEDIVVADRDVEEDIVVADRVLSGARSCGERNVGNEVSCRRGERDSRRGLPGGVG